MVDLQERVQAPLYTPTMIIRRVTMSEVTVSTGEQGVASVEGAVAETAAAVAEAVAPSVASVADTAMHVLTETNSRLTNELELMTVQRDTLAAQLAEAQKTEINVVTIQEEPTIVEDQTIVEETPVVSDTPVEIVEDSSPAMTQETEAEHTDKRRRRKPFGKR